PTKDVAGAPVNSTERSCICADASMRARVSSSAGPGICTTIWLPAWVLMSDSPTPEASTRCRMIVAACVIWSLVGAAPSGVLACRMICVPPCRSSASSGTQDASLNTYTPRALKPNRTAMTRSRPSRARQACLTGVDAATEGQLSRERGGSGLGRVLLVVLGAQPLGGLVRRLDLGRRLGLRLIGDLGHRLLRVHHTQDRLAVHLDVYAGGDLYEGRLVEVVGVVGHDGAVEPALQQHLGAGAGLQRLRLLFGLLLGHAAPRPPEHEDEEDHQED